MEKRKIEDLGVRLFSLPLAFPFLPLQSLVCVWAGPGL